jgi:decaprenylphospho-beta-D-ribofuranose 2-oxidase
MARWAMMELTGWGRVHRARGPVARPERSGDLAAIVAAATEDTLLARGAGRSYGDAALNSRGCSVLMGRLDRFLDFDDVAGRLTAEAGATFLDALSLVVPRGYMLPVVPGTGHATLGGGVANDVHGKNHHRAGSLGEHIEWLDLRLPSGECRRVTPQGAPELFRATVGGVGLTGFIERICLRLTRVPSNAVMVRKRRVRNLEEHLAALAEEHDRAEYLVGWIDALAKGRHLGRGVLEAGNPASEGVPPPRRRRLRVPCDFPPLALNAATVRAFNAMYYRHAPARGGEQRLPYERFFFPLDALLDWNRVYGRRGFHQFQCVVPFDGGSTAVRRMLEVTGTSGHGSFLAVLKAMGPRGPGYLSFAQPGYTLALDFPNAPGAAQLITRLEAIACDAGGRIYLAKDSTASADSIRRMYPELPSFKKALGALDPRGRMGSDLARRLGLSAEAA